MLRQYHYLVASLPEFEFGTDNAKLDTAALRDEIKEGLAPADLADLELLYTYYDIQNILLYLKNGKVPFNQLGNLDPAQVKAEIDGTDEEGEIYAATPLPPAIRLAIDQYKGRGTDEELDPDADINIPDIERRLFSDFYTLCGRSKSKFLRQWSDIDRTLRNITAVSQARKTGIDPSGMVIGDGPVEKQLLSSQSSDFGIRDDFKYAEQLFQVLDTPDFVERERKMDTLRWSIAENLAEFEYFTLSTVMAFCVKMNIVYRWEALDRAEGRDRFRLIVEHLTEIDADKN